MKTKKIKTSVGTLTVRGLTAGELTENNILEQEITREYKDLRERAKEKNKLSFQITAYCIQDNSTGKEVTAEELMGLSALELAEINNAIAELTGTRVASSLKKK